MLIGITDTLNEDKYEQYVEWIRLNDKSAEIKKLSYQLDNLSEAEKIDGLILTGGGDVHPKFYGKENQAAKTNGVNTERDEFEFNLIERALDLDIPILGICRGMQVMNVYLGGTLVVDLELNGFNKHTSALDDEPTKHKIVPAENTLMQILINSPDAEVNSFHHQGIDRVGKGLVASTLSIDNVIESCEWVMKDNMPFLLLVQWHPERIVNELLSQKIAKVFLREVQQKEIYK